MSELPRVYIARVKTGYDDQAALVQAIRRGLEYVGWTPAANIVAQVNLDFVYPDLAPIGYTRPEVVRAALTVLFETSKEAKATILAGGPLDLPARQQARAARGRGPELQQDGYFGLERCFPGRVEVAPLDEEPLRSYRLSTGDALDQDAREARDPGATVEPRGRHAHEVRAPARLADADALVLFPKLKSSVRWHGFQGAIGLAGGLLPAASERTAASGLWRARRCVDFLEVAEPDLIITDAIEVAVGGSEMTARPHNLGCLVIARNAVAHDATLARFFGMRPDQIEPIRLACERDYGPIWANEMDYEGDMGVGETSSHVKGFGTHGVMPVVDFPKRFERDLRLKVPVEILAAQPWDPCGSQGLLLDFLYTLYDQPKERRKLMAQWAPMTLLAGGFPDGPPPAPAHPIAVVVGDAAIDVWRRAGFGAARGGTESFKTASGASGKAYFVRGGEPPQMLDLARAVAKASGGRAASPILQVQSFWDRVKASLGMGAAPKQLVAGTTEAADIARLAERKAERLKPKAAPVAAPVVGTQPTMAPPNPPKPRHLVAAEAAAAAAAAAESAKAAEPEEDGDDGDEGEGDEPSETETDKQAEAAESPQAKPE